MFECSKCGECCRNLNKSEIYASLHNGDGVCKYLDGDLCSIYENRPLLCDVEKSFMVFFDKKISYEKYLELNYKYCDELKRLRQI